MFLALIDTPQWPQLVEFFGRVHPMLVHFPIALILVAAAVEFLRARRDGPQPAPTALFCLTLGALAAALSAWSGWTWAEHEDLGRSLERTLFLHRWSGVGLAGVATLSTLIAWSVRWKPNAPGATLYRATLFLAVLLVGAAGHLGAKLVHGDILEVFATESEAEPAADAASEGLARTEVDPNAPASDPSRAFPEDLLGAADGAALEAAPEAPADGSAPIADRVVFATEVRPIFAARCYECHGQKKKKAGLRLDLVEELFLGEQEGWVIQPGDVAASPLYQRITLPDEDPDRMPSKGDPLTPEQIAVIRSWIEQGARWDEGTGADGSGEEAADTPALEADAREGSAPSAPAASKGTAEHNELGAPGAPQLAADPAAPIEEPLPVLSAQGEAALDALQRHGALAARVAADSPLVAVSFSLLGKDVGDADLALLEGLEPNLVELDLSRTQVTDAGLARLRGCARLQHLKLSTTAVGDEGLRALEGLTRLEVLNLYGTRATDAGLEHLTDLRALRRLYLWQTAVTDAGIARLRAALPVLTVVGDELAALAAVAAAIEAEQAAVAYTVPCCEAATAKGEECAHPCCVEARAAGTLCPTCRVEVAAADEK